MSVTFRALAPAEVISLAVQANVRLMEWGGDIHLPPGDVSLARKIGAQTREAGLQAASYASYYRVGETEQNGEFERCLESAQALEAPLIRVWTGVGGAAAASRENSERAVQDTRRICRLAEEAGVAVAYEFHGGTLTDSVETTIQMLTRSGSSNLRTLWQPLGSKTPEMRTAEIGTLLPWLAHVHVFHWPDGVRVPLAEGEQEWMAPLAVLARAERPVGLFLEFVRGDSPEQFLADVATLHRWIAKTQGEESRE